MDQNQQPQNPTPPQQSLTTIHVMVRNREKTLYNDIAKAVSSNNEKGKFDVLAQHGNFISMIKDYIRILKTDGTKVEMKIQNGIMQVTPQGCTVFIGILSGENLENPGTPPAGAATQPPQQDKK
jgi:hypothetical protein